MKAGWCSGRAMALWCCMACVAIGSAWAEPYLAIFGENAENRVYHFYIDEAGGESSSVELEFWPNTSADQAQVVTTLNRRDYATLDNPDWYNDNLGCDYWVAHDMTGGGGGYSLTLPVELTGSYDIRVRVRFKSGGQWHYYGGRNPVVNVSDVSTRDLVVYELQANVMDATGDDFNTRSTFGSLTAGEGRFSLDYLEKLGVNCIWLQPFHPIGAKDDCNYGELGSPYSIKNLFQVAPHLGSQNTRENAMHEFTNFVQEAASKGISVIFDVIFNHVATDVEIERDPSNPYQLYHTPSAEMRDVRPQWFSRYVGDHPECSVSKPDWDHGNYLWWEPAQNRDEIGPAPADRHDFVWPDAYDLFWGTYPALGNIGDTSDGEWVLSNDVKEMVDYYAYFIEYWIEVTGGHTGGFRCDFAQGIPRKAWQYLINRGKSVKHDLYFVSESLDGGSVAYRAWKGGFDAINENQLWAIVENYDITTTDLRQVIDSRKTQFGLALILRGTMNHDQGPWIGRRYDAVAMHSVFCAIDGTPQMYFGQEMGYDNTGQFSRERVEFGRTIPQIREYHNINNLWNNLGADTMSPSLDIWWRYKEANDGRARAEVLRTANQYYLDQLHGGPQQKIFSVLKYENFERDPADQEVVLAFVNLSPQQAQSGTFNVDVEAISLDPNKTYNVRNLASGSPETYLWAEARTGADIKANGIHVSFSGNPWEQNSIAQYLKLEVEGDPGGEAVTGLYNAYHWPTNQSITSTDDIWINIESHPIGAGDFGFVVYSANGGATWHTRSLSISPDSPNNDNDWWHVNLGRFSPGAQISYAVSVTDKLGNEHWDNNQGTNFHAFVNQTGEGDLWVGHTATWPKQGDIEPYADLWVDSFTTHGLNQGVFIHYDLNGADTWEHTESLNWFQNVDDLSQWHVNLGGFPAGTVIQFVIRATNETEEVWDNNNGNDYVRTVSGQSGALQWIGNTRYIPGRKAELAGARRTAAGRPGFRLEAKRAGGSFRIERSTNLLDWTEADEVTMSELTLEWEDTEDVGDTVYYRVTSHNLTQGGTVRSGDELVIRIESYPIGRATGGSIVYSTTGINWQSKPLSHVGTANNNDIWQVRIGPFSSGINVQYAIELVDTDGVSRWDNNSTENYHVNIRSADAGDEEPPVLSHSPQNTETGDPTLTLTLTATDNEDPNPSIYYTDDGSTPTTGSTLYTVPLVISENTTIKAIAVDASGNISPVRTIEVRVNQTHETGGWEPYSTNPTFGQAGTMTINGNPSGWTTNHLIAIDMANDDPRSLGDNWTMHEAPIDFTHMWAAWDDDNLYVAWQLVDVTDVIDGANAGSAAGGKISNNDGILKWIVIDTIPGQGATEDVWGKKNSWMGPNKPNYQVYLAGSLWQGYISRAVDGVFALDDGGVNYMTIGAAGIEVAKGDTFATDGAGGVLLGVGNTDERHDGHNRDFLQQGHNTERDSFYEMSIPLSFLGITRADIENSGIGIMIGAGSESSMGSIPHDEATLSTPGVSDWNSSLEWTDEDVFTSPFARIGK